MAPILVQVGPFTLYTHDFFTVIGILAGLALYYRALKRDRVLDGRIVLISVAAILGGALGARLITSWEILDEVSAANLPLTHVITQDGVDLRRDAVGRIAEVTATLLV